MACILCGDPLVPAAWPLCAYCLNPRNRPDGLPAELRRALLATAHGTAERAAEIERVRAWKASQAK